MDPYEITESTANVIIDALADEIDRLRKKSRPDDQVSIKRSRNERVVDAREAVDALRGPRGIRVRR